MFKGCIRNDSGAAHVVVVVVVVVSRSSTGQALFFAIAADTLPDVCRGFLCSISRKEKEQLFYLHTLVGAVEPP